MRKLVIAAIVIAGWAAAASAETVMDPKICVTQSLTPGSRIETRVCHTKAEWDVINQNAQSKMDMWQSHLHTTSSGAWTDHL